MLQYEPERGPLFDFERLIVYQRTMQLRCLVNPLTSNSPKGAAHLVDHLDRAVDSVLLNVPEGNGFPRGSAKRKNHFRIALGSAKEAASAVNALRAKGKMDPTMGAKARALLIEIVRMLEKMSR
ncbi:MAG: four helix bundle protein [Planctomycetota bacterium]|jgi:four helix bundle protein